MAFTDWLPAVGLDTVMMVLKRKAVQTAGTAPTMNFKLAIQVATIRTDNPSDPAVIEGTSTYTGAGESNSGALNVASLTAGKAYVRFGVMYYLGGTTPKDGPRSGRRGACASAASAERQDAARAPAPGPGVAPWTGAA